MSKVLLKVITGQLSEPVGRGRVILQDQAIPIRGADQTDEYICGSCSAKLLTGFDPVRFIYMFGGAEIIIRCNECKSYNDATPPPLPPFHLDTNLLPKVKALLSHALKARNSLFLRFQGLDTNDPRLSVASHLLDVASATYLNLINVKENLRENSWWEGHGFGEAVSAGIIPSLLENYMSLTAGSFIFFSFSLFESGIRRIVRALDPSACSGGASEFKGIYEWLLARLRKEGWTYVSGDPAAYLDLFRTFRNTLHNNGAFYPPKSGNYEVTWKGTKYSFVYGSVPNFYGWEFNLMLLTELVSLNQEVMTSNLVARISRIS